MGIKSSPALLDSKATGDLHASQLTSCKNKSINLTQSFLQVGQEDEGKVSIFIILSPLTEIQKKRGIENVKLATCFTILLEGRMKMAQVSAFTFSSVSMYRGKVILQQVDTSGNKYTMFSDLQVNITPLDLCCCSQLLNHSRDSQKEVLSKCFSKARGMHSIDCLSLLLTHRITLNEKSPPAYTLASQGLNNAYNKALRFSGTKLEQGGQAQAHGSAETHRGHQTLIFSAVARQSLSEAHFHNRWGKLELRKPHTTISLMHPMMTPSFLQHGGCNRHEFFIFSGVGLGLKFLQQLEFGETSHHQQHYAVGHSHVNGGEKVTRTLLTLLEWERLPKGTGNQCWYQANANSESAAWSKGITASKYGIRHNVEAENCG
ncbi:hypothetical protein Anapl_12062 [Anas platyrhynchos]|uniref:Uncharacterized protein n=1 Tax=Anas platyrhynchos TaxID=8839 RepID=R0JF98_ANAPL|nr:hypothetical protein Anapl_12062 [Anas platyrhynchos]